MVYPWIMDDRFNAAFPNMAPAVPPVRSIAAPPPVMPGVYKMQGNPEEYAAWQRGNPIPTETSPVTPNVAANQYPAGGAAPVAYAPKPVLEQSSQGVTLNTSPLSP